MLYTVGEMAKLLDVAPSTLRYYDKEGLLPFVERSDGGTRLFKDADYEWLKIIECLKRTGMPIKDIHDYMALAVHGDETLAERLELIRRQKKRVAERIKELREMSRMLDYKEWYYETAVAAGTSSFLENMREDDIPPQFAAVRKSLKKK